jgi:Undecaprenyl-phosphate galactose phosphotransferase WbaP
MIFLILWVDLAGVSNVGLRNMQCSSASPETTLQHPATTSHIVYPSRSISPSGDWLRAVSLFLGDACAFAAAGIVGGFTAFILSSYLLNIQYLGFEQANLFEQFFVFASIALGLCAWFARLGHYTERRLFRTDVADILSALLFGLLISGFIEFASKSNFSRLWLVMTWLLAAAAIPLTRIVVRKVLNGIGMWIVNAVIIGESTHREKVKESLTSDLYLGYNVNLDGSIGSYVSVPHESIGSRLSVLMKAYDFSSIILAPSNEEMPYLRNIIDVLNVQMIPYKVVPPIERLPLAGLSTQSFISSDAILLTVQSGLSSPINQMVKRLFDIVSSLFLLITLSPLLLIVSLAVAADGGQVLFGHNRVGRRDAIFECLKFRTMVPHAERALENLLRDSPEARREWIANHKLRDDPRTTTLGRMLRSTSIDELPQLINVFRGDMSLVGPRPVVRQELQDHYKSDYSYYLLVRPGITGLWQISGRSNTIYEERVHLDAWYVRNWSLWGDIIILLRTLPAIIHRTGAY